MQLMLVEVSHERRLFADAKPSVLLLHQTKMLGPTLQHLGKAPLHLIPQRDGVDIGNGFGKVDAPAPSHQRWHRRELRHIFAVGRTAVEASAPHSFLDVAPPDRPPPDLWPAV